MSGAGSRPLRVLVVGAAGYVGGELLRLLLQHPDVGAVTAQSRSQAGKPVERLHPTLAPLVGRLTSQLFAAEEAAELAPGHDVVFLALDHGESGRIAPGILAAEPPLVVDLAADFRIGDPALAAATYGPHPAPDLLGTFTYGLADVLGPSLRGHRRIAAPGCFATAAQLALYPLAGLGGLTDPSLFAITGSSGAGARPRETTHHPLRAHNLFAYSHFGHRHEAEILTSWRRWTGRLDAGARLLVHSGPMVRGIYLTLHASVPTALPAGAVAAAFRQHYAGRPLVRIVDEPPQLTHAVGTSLAVLHATQSSDGKEIAVNVAIDNLLKGAAGQAVQAMNLALGLSETAGLLAVGAFPC